MRKRILAHILIYTILVLVGILTAPACVDLSSIEDTVRDTIRDEFAEDEENLGDCRKYPAVSITNGSTVANCTFSIAERKYSCVSGTVTTEHFYTSVESFVEEDDRYFRDYADWARITDTEPATDEVTIVLYTRNTNNQITDILYQQIEGAAAPLEEKSITYSEWDGRNRPTTGTMSTSDGTDTCTNQSIAIEYDSEARTKTETISGGTDSGSYCVTSTTVTTLNSAGLVISEVENFTVSGATDTSIIENTDIGEVCEKQDISDPPVDPSAGTLAFALTSASADNIFIKAFSGSTLVAASESGASLTAATQATFILQDVDTDGSPTGESVELDAGNYDVYIQFEGVSDLGGLVSLEVDGDRQYTYSETDFSDALFSPVLNILGVGGVADGTLDCSWLRPGADQDDTAAVFATCTIADLSASTTCTSTDTIIPAAYDVFCESTDLDTADLHYDGRLNGTSFPDATAVDITLTEVP